MVRHVVCFKLKDNSAESKIKAKETLLSMKGRVDLLQNIEVGVDFLCSDRSYDVVLITDFLSREDLEAYQKDEFHCSVIKPYMHEVRTSSVAVDYEF